MRLVFILGIVIFFVCKTQAQSAYLDSSFVAQPIHPDTFTKKYLPLYLQVFAGLGELFANNNHLSQELIVPYTSTSSGANMLTINKNNFIGNNFSMIGGGFEIGIGMFFVNITVHEMLSNSFKYGKLPNGSGLTALGVNIPFQYKKKQFTLQIASVLYSIDYDFPLEPINNTNAVIDILGQQANPTFNYKSTSAKSGQWNYTGTVHATQLNIDFQENQLYLAPKIGICSNPLRSKFHWGFYTMYNFPIYKDEYFSLSQDGTVSGHDVTFSNYLSKVRIARSDATLYNNGLKASSTPYIARGFSLILTVGYNFINGANSNKKSKK